MKIILYRLYGLAAALCLSFSSSAQDTLFSSVPGTSFADIITAMKADTTIMNDTSEGGGRIKLLAYEQFWKDRVGKTDSSGTDMFPPLV